MSVAVIFWLLAIVLGGLAGWLGWTRYRRPGQPGPAGQQLAIHELAYLAGGAPRVVTTALAMLSHSGRVTITGTGRASQTATGGGPDPVQGAILQALRRRGTVPVAGVYRGLARSGVLEAMGVRLVRRRLLGYRGIYIPRWLRLLIGLGAFGGLAITVASYLRGQLALVPYSALAVTWGTGALLLARRGVTVQPGAAGQRVLAAAHLDCERGAPAVMAGGMPVLATRVALDGPSSLADPSLRAILTTAERVAADDPQPKLRWRPGTGLPPGTDPSPPGRPGLLGRGWA
ncbi:MAG TPA: TIGR04222 domain-containing membrane protein [Streptosporangiaceae bacterium]